MHVKPGQNIALKIPAHLHADTVAFYRDVLRLPVLQELADAVVFEFGSVRLWLDRIEHQSQTDVWFELRTDDLEQATRLVSDAGAPVRDQLEPLGSLRAHWISDPAGVVLLLNEDKAADG